MIKAWRLSCTYRKNMPPHEAYQFNVEERLRVLDSVKVQRHADLTPAQIVASRAEDGMYISSKSAIYRILCH